MLRAASRLVLRGPARARAFSNTGSSSSNEHKARIRATAYYAAAVVIGATGASFAAVPLYKMFCQATGYGGTTKKHDLVGNGAERKSVCVCDANMTRLWRIGFGFERDEACEISTVESVVQCGH